ncbi:MAG: phosphotransferase [Ilumatobacter sp.]|uniref:phosphotransferase n=1 Tax=Ilumatobacter sp. TaxID=1967498 RepID=UPI003298207B
MGTTGNIAGIEIGLPSGIGEVTAEWMTAALRASGGIGAESTVASVRNEPFVAGGLLSLLYRSTIESEDPDAPATVIVKFPTDVPQLRAMADAVNVYGREVAFYRDIAPRSTIAMPIVHAAMSADDHSNSCIVMEDLARLRQPDRTAGMTWDDAVRGARALAAFHAGWQGSPELTELMDTYMSMGSPLNRTVLPGVAGAGWPAAKLHRGHTLSDDVVAVGDMWVDVLPKMLDRMELRPTLCHEDWRADNMFFDANDDVVMIDPQLAGVCNGAFDLAYFISQSTEREMLDGRHAELVAEYLSVMAENGHDLDPEVFFFDTRVAVGLVLMYGFASYPDYEALTDEGKAMTDKILRRGAEAIEDFESLAALRSLVD